MRFVHDNLPQRVCFGSGEAGALVAAEVTRLGAARVMVISSSREAPVAQRLTADVPVVLHYHDVVMHVPVEVAERAREAAVKAEADAVVAIGGGSTTGLAKAIAMTSGLPIIAVPTTYAGSEATAVWGLTTGDVKSTGTDLTVLPKSVVYDATLTASLPVDVSVASGLNALAHCVDSLWAPSADPINAALAVEGIRSLAAGLPQVVADPAGLPGRERALYAAYVSAVAFASAARPCTTRSATCSAASTTSRTRRPTRRSSRMCWRSTGRPRRRRRAESRVRSARDLRWRACKPCARN